MRVRIGGIISLKTSLQNIRARSDITLRVLTCFGRTLGSSEHGAITVLRLVAALDLWTFQQEHYLFFAHFL